MLVGNIVNTLNVSDWIQIISIAATTLISIVSVIIALKSLNLTRKSIENSNKPFLACYIEMIEVGHFQKYLIIKNFGRTPAIITNIHFDRKITGLGRFGEINSIKDAMIAPGQKFISVLDVKEKDTVTVVLEYKDLNNQKTISKFRLNLGYTWDLAYKHSRKSNLSDDTNEWRNMLHDLIKRTL